MKSIDPETKSEIIIVRRGGHGDHDGHHGGAWKIAYADFMTAMMAFFLVMWLINSVNEDSKAAIASYFNPIKLVDLSANPRGLDEERSKVKFKSQTEGEDPDKGYSPAEEGVPGAEAQEVQLMKAPFEALEAIIHNEAGSEIHMQGMGGASEGGSQQGSSEGTAYRDPFSPEYWSTNMPMESEVSEGKANPDASQATDTIMKDLAKLQKDDAADKDDIAQSQSSQTDEDAREETAEIAASQGMAMDKAGSEKIDSDKSKTESVADSAAAKLAKADEEKAQKAAKTTNLVKDISTDITALIKDTATDAQPLVRVTPVDEGVAIELTDSQNYGMFSVGSAKPDKKVVELIEGIAKILQKHEGEVVVSGHTDGRPFKTTRYDNWQLSAARAQMAYYMLVRGGLDEKRVLRVEGYADRDLKNKEDSNAAENRRIAIFLKLPKTGKQ